MNLEKKELDYKNYRLQKYLSLVYKSLGRTCEVRGKRGEQGDGFFGGFDLNSGNILFYNYCKLNEEKIQDKNKISMKNLKYLVIKNINPKNEVVSKKELVKKESAENKNIFLTDKAITKKKNNNLGLVNLDKKEKSFQKWTPQINLEEEDLLEKSNYKKFDQFSENAKLNNICEEFNLDDYSTKLDLSKFSKKDIEEAKRQEEEILNGKHSNFINRHILEERGLVELKDNSDDEEDEEQLYSAVDMPVLKIKPSFSKKNNSDQNLMKIFKHNWSQNDKNKNVSNFVKGFPQNNNFQNNLYYNSNNFNIQNYNYFQNQFFNLNYNNLNNNQQFYFPNQNDFTNNTNR